MDIKKSAKQAGIGLLYSILLIQLFRWLRPTIIITGMILVGISVIWMLAKKNFSWKKLLKSIITISIILTIFRYAGFLGIAGIFGAIILVALFMLYVRREAFKEAIWDLQRHFYGKTLREFDQAGEKRPKLKFSLKK